LQQREGEAGGLAGARLGRAEEVAAGEDDRDGLRLDGGGDRVALVGYGAREIGGKPEAFKSRANQNSPELGLGRGDLRPVQADAIFSLLFGGSE
jgi:hypothetical protein